MEPAPPPPMSCAALLPFRSRGLAAILFASLLVASSLPAQIVFTWDGGPDSSFDGAWANAVNWAGDTAVPGFLDIARFNAPHTYSVGITGHPAVDKVEVTSGTVTFNVDGGSELHIGNRLTVHSSTLVVNNGTASAKDADLFNATIRLDGGNLKITGETSPNRTGEFFGVLKIEGNGILEANLNPPGAGGVITSGNTSPGSLIRADGGNLRLVLSSDSALSGTTGATDFRHWSGDVEVQGNTLTVDTGTVAGGGGRPSRIWGNTTLAGGSLIATGGLFLDRGPTGTGLIEADYVQISAASLAPSTLAPWTLAGNLTLRARTGTVATENPFHSGASGGMAFPVTVGPNTLRIEASKAKNEWVLFSLSGGTAETDHLWSFSVVPGVLATTGFAGHGLIRGPIELFVSPAVGAASESASPLSLLHPTGSVASIGTQTIGSGTLTVLSNTPVQIAGALSLGGGEVRSTGGWTFGPSGAITGHGIIWGDLAGPLAVTATAALTGGQTYFGGSEPVFWLSSAPVTMSAPERKDGATITPLPITLDQGLLWSPAGIVIPGLDLGGSGELRGPISGNGSLTLGGNFILGDAGSTSGVVYDGTVTVGTHTLTLRDANSAQLGGPVSLAGGTIAAPNGVAFANTVSGSGTVTAAVTGNGTITATGNLTLGDATAPVGFNFSGTLNVGPHQVTLLSGSAPAFLGPLTTLAGGLLSSVTGFSVDAGEQITGAGLLRGAFGGSAAASALAPTGTFSYASPFAIGSGEAWLLANGAATFTDTVSLSGGSFRGSSGAVLKLGATGALKGGGSIHVLLDATTGTVTPMGNALSLLQGGTFGATVGGLGASGSLALGGGTSRFLSGSTTTLPQLFVSGGNATIETGATFFVPVVTVTGGSLAFEAGASANLGSTNNLLVNGTGTATLHTASTLTLPPTTTVSGDGTTSGTLTGTGSWQVASGRTLTIDRGTINGTGNISVPTGAAVAVTASHATIARDIVNDGVVRLNPADVPYSPLAANATITNRAGASLRLLDAPWTVPGANPNAIWAGNLSVVNAGTVTVGTLGAATGSAASVIFATSGAFSNSGTVLFNHTAQLRLLGGGIQTGTFFLGTSTDSHLVFSGGHTIHVAPTTFTGNGWVHLDGGTLHTSGGAYQPNFHVAFIGAAPAFPGVTSLVFDRTLWVGGELPALPVSLLAGADLRWVHGAQSAPITVAHGAQLQFWGGVSIFLLAEPPADATVNSTIENHGTTRILGSHSLGPLTGTGQVHNHPDGVLTNQTDTGLFSSTVQFLVDVVNEGLVELEARELGLVRLRDLTNTGQVRLRATETTPDTANDLGIQLGKFTQTAGTITLETSGSSFGTLPLPYVQADEFNLLGGTAAATGRLVVPSLLNQATFTVGFAGLELTGNFLNQPGADLRLDGRLTLTNATYNLTLASGSRLLLNGPGADVYRGNTSLYGGDFVTPAGATIEIRNGRNLDGNGTLTTHGLLILGAGSSATRLGSLAGTGEIRVASGGSLTLGGNASWAGTGLINLLAGGTLNLGAHDNDLHRFYNRPITNAGTVNHTAANLGVNANTLIENSGLWRDSTGSNFRNDDGQTGTGLFRNLAGGTFRKEGGGTLTFEHLRFENSGAIEVTGGGIVFGAGSQLAAGSTVTLASGTGLHLGGGAHSIGSGVTISGGTFSIGSPTTFQGDVTATNGVFWSAPSGTPVLHGNWSLADVWMTTVATTRIAADGVLNIGSHANGIHRFDNHTLINQGTLHHTASSFGTTTSTTIINQGTWNESSDGRYLTPEGLTPGGSFVNEGTFRKIGANTSTFETAGPTFTNQGTVDVQQGVLQLYNRQTAHVGTALTGGTWIVRSGAELREDSRGGYTVNQGSVTMHGTGIFWGFSGSLTRNEGTLRLLDGNAFVGGASAFTNTGTLEVGTGSSFSTPSSLANSGTLRIAGTLVATGGLANTGTLSGVGTITGAVVSAGTLSPGSSPGLLLINGNLTLQGTSQLLMELGGLTRGATYDAIDVSGALTLAGSLVVAFVNGFSPAVGQSFDLLNFTTASGSFSQITLPTLGTGLAWDTSALTSTGVLAVGASAIPEPSTWSALAGLGALAATALRRRRARG